MLLDTLCKCTCSHIQLKQARGPVRSAEACERLKPPLQVYSYLKNAYRLTDRSYSKCDQALEWLCANELENDIKAVGQTSAPQRCCSQSASLECGHFSCCPAHPPGRSLSEDPAGLDSICAALLPVQRLPTLEASGKYPCQPLTTPGVITT